MKISVLGVVLPRFLSYLALLGMMIGMALAPDRARVHARSSCREFHRDGTVMAGFYEWSTRSALGRIVRVLVIFLGIAFSLATGFLVVALFAWMLIEVPWALLPLGSRSKKRSPLTARQVFLLLLLAFLYLSALVALAASLQWLYFTFAPIVRSASADDIVLWTGIVVAVWLVASAWITHSILAYADSRPPRPRWPRDRFPTNDARIAQPYEPFGPEGELNARTLLRRPGTPIQGKKSGGL